MASQQHSRGFHPAPTRPTPVYSGSGTSAAASSSSTRLFSLSGQLSPSRPVASPEPAGHQPHMPRVPPMAAKEFRDFDDPGVYKGVLDYAKTENALNFVVQFGDNKAQVAYDLGEAEFRQLLRQPSPQLNDGTTPIRWINIWNPSRQKAVIEAIGEHYHFSKRLTMSIWAWDVFKGTLTQDKPQATREPRTPFHRHAHEKSVATGVAMATSAVDPEGGKVAFRSSGISPGGATVLPPGFEEILDPENLATFKMMQSNLNYTSMDQESKFVCIGANWLHRRPSCDKAKPKTYSLVPPKHWSWFVLCDDYTVISFHEAAHYDKIPRDADAAKWKAEELINMRSNTLKVLRQLSTCGLKERQHKFQELTSVREPGRQLTGDALGLESSSNLFYYLFEDYSATFHILNTSKTALDDISGRVLHTDDWKTMDDMSDIIPLLYRLNKEMRQLHHLFTNYKSVIGRLVSSEAKIADEGTAIKEKLSAKAANRFNRLQVQMQSLMLDAITDCLDEKRSLQETYFNLMTQKDSRSTERLTRSATLLAKLSVFFLPISFMTSYFSVQIPHMSDNYTALTYWGSFAVIASISFLSLFFFSKVLMFLSERLDHVSDQAARWTYSHVGWAQRKPKRAMEEEDGL